MGPGLTELWPVLVLVTVWAVASGVALAVRAAALASLRRYSGVDAARLVAAAVRRPSVFWCVLVGLYVANEVAFDFTLLAAHWHDRLRTLLDATVVASVTWVCAGVAGQAVARVSERNTLGMGVTGLAQTTARVAIFAAGVLVLLPALGVQVAPLLTALGVGGLAVALGLQDTLANLFAGIHLLADRPIRVGDYVKVSDAGEGFVVDIGWRSTWIRTLANTVVVAPNQAVAKATIINYSLPDSRVSLGLKVSVDYSVDPDRVERILLDEVTQALDHVPGLLREPPPGVSLVPGFGESSLDFSIGYSVRNVVDQYRVQHELRGRILRRFHKEGLSIAVPARTVRLEHASEGDQAVVGSARGDRVASVRGARG